MKLILRYLAPLKRSIAFGLTIKVLATLLELALPYVLSYILDGVVPRGQVVPILLFGGVMILCAFGAFISTWWPTAMPPRWRAMPRGRSDTIFFTPRCI